MTSTAKTSKIKKVVKCSEYDGKFGKTFYHHLEMENGDKIDIGKKKEQLVGWELTYDIVEVGQQEYNKARAVAPEGLNSFSPKKPTNNKSDDIQLMIVKQSCLKIAIEYHGMQKGGDRSDVIDHAQYFTDWVMDDCCANKPSENKDSNNDMPF